MQIEQSTLKATPSGICTVEDGVIYEVNALYGTKTRVGVTDGKYNELKELADSYYNKLVELGAIVPPKTPEQIQQETMQVMQGMLKQMQTLQQNYEAKLAAKDATIERMTLAQNMTTQFTALQREIEGIKANMLTKPNITGVGAVCPNAGIVNGLGIGSSIGGYCCGAGSIA